MDTGPQGPSNGSGGHRLTSALCDGPTSHVLGFDEPPQGTFSISRTALNLWL